MDKKVRILSLDGGGIRGIIPATVLTYVEEQLIKKTGNENARLGDYFDMMVGTSTGGILACFYLTPNPNAADNAPTVKYTAMKALEFYSLKGKLIFSDAKKHGWFGLRQLLDATKFDPGNIEQIFQEEFEDLKLSDLVKPCIVTSYNMASESAVFFNSREAAEKKREYLLRDVVRSTSAAPTYFPPAFIKNMQTNEELINIDGGVFANNPAVCAYAEARTTVFPQVENPSAKHMLILSIGTGGGRMNFESLNKARNWGVTKWAKNIPEIMMDGSLDTVNYQMMRMFATLEGENKLNYKRINVPEDKRNYNSDMSDASDENISRLRMAGEEALKSANMPAEGQHTLDKFIDLLIENAP